MRAGLSWAIMASTTKEPCTMFSSAGDDDPAISRKAPITRSVASSMIAAARVSLESKW